MTTTQLKSIELTETRRVCSPAGAIQLGSADLGCGVDENGKIVYFAWGHNLTADQAAKRSDICKIAFIGRVWEGDEQRENFSEIVPDAIARAIMVGTFVNPTINLDAILGMIEGR